MKKKKILSDTDFAELFLKAFAESPKISDSVPVVFLEEIEKRLPPMSDFIQRIMFLEMSGKISLIWGRMDNHKGYEWKGKMYKTVMVMS